jgi:hypothetical protein
VNAAQRRTTRRALVRAWPKGMKVTSRRFEGEAKVSGCPRAWPGMVTVVGGGTGRIIHARHLRSAPITAIGKAVEKLGDSMVRGMESLGKLNTTINDMQIRRKA